MSVTPQNDPYQTTKGSSLCLDCGKPQSEPGVPAICAAWHEKGSP